MNVTITGIDDVNRILADIAPREARNILQNTTYDIAKQLSNDAKTHAPNDPRTPGNYSSAFKAKRRRMKGTVLGSDAIVETTKANRAFIWRFHEYGQGPDHVEYAMFLKAFQKMKPQITSVYMTAFGKALEKRLKRLRK